MAPPLKNERTTSGPRMTVFGGPGMYLPQQLTPSTSSTNLSSAASSSSSAPSDTTTTTTTTSPSSATSSHHTAGSGVYVVPPSIQRPGSYSSLPATIPSR